MLILLSLNYTDMIYSKMLHDVWSSIPHYSSVRSKYYSDLKATFGDKDPDSDCQIS